MHNIDRSTNEFEFGQQGEQEYGFLNEWEFQNEEVGEFQNEELGEFQNEELEFELATELLSVSNEMELEQFLGGLFKKVAGGLSSFAKSGIGKSLIGGLKSIAKKALPIVGGVAGNFLVPGLGGAIGSKLGGLASGMFELELEGLSNEDREFEVARRYVRFATEATRNAAKMANSSAAPQTIVNDSLKRAAANHAPGLLRKRGGSGSVGGRSSTGGSWARSGNNIILYGA